MMIYKTGILNVIGRETEGVQLAGENGDILRMPDQLRFWKAHGA
jgi:hypothetical protein